MAPRNSSGEGPKFERGSSRANASREALGRRSEAKKVESYASILGAFTSELTCYRTASELAAAIGLAESTVSLRLDELIVAGQLVRDAAGIHRPWPGRRWDWESARAAGERQLEQRIKGEDLISARQAAKQHISATLALLQEASQTLGPRAPQSSTIAGDAAVLIELAKRLERCTSVQELALLVDDALAALHSPIEQWVEATRQREQLAQLAQAEMDRSWSQWGPYDFRCAHSLPPETTHQNGPPCPVPEWVLERLERRPGRRARSAFQSAGDLFGRLNEAFQAQQGLSKRFALPAPPE